MILLLAGAAAWAGAWTKGEGEAYAKLGADGYVASGFVDPLTGLPDDVSYAGWQPSLYAEVGLPTRVPLQATLSVPVSVGTITFDADGAPGGGVGKATTVRAGDLRLGAQLGVPTARGALSVALEGKVPLYDIDSVGLKYFLLREFFPRPGDGNVDLTGLVQAGTSSSRGWAELAFGARARLPTEYQGRRVTFADGGVLRAKLGLRLGPVAALIEADTFFHGVPDDTITREWLTAGAGALWTVSEGWGVEARVSRDLWARNGAKGTGFGGGVSWRR